VPEGGFYVFRVTKRKIYDIPAVIVSGPEKVFFKGQIGRFCYFYWQILHLLKFGEKLIPVGDLRGKSANQIFP